VVASCNATQHNAFMHSTTTTHLDLNDVQWLTAFKKRVVEPSPHPLPHTPRVHKQRVEGHLERRNPAVGRVRLSVVGLDEAEERLCAPSSHSACEEPSTLWR
jgi:hypothetical protein